MKNWITGLSLSVVVLVAGCGKLDEAKQAAENMKELGKAAENMQEKVDANAARREERRKRGDTLAMHYQEMQKYLPESVAGYTAKDPVGQTSNMGGMSFSQAERTYSKTGADGTEDYVTVTLLDYNATADLYTGMTALWGANFSMEDQNGYSKSFDAGVKDVAGWEHYDKQGKNSEVTLALGGRFILTIKANSQANNDMAKSLAKTLKLSDLAAK